jgi:hypothetical protein
LLAVLGIVAGFLMLFVALTLSPATGPVVYNFLSTIDLGYVGTPPWQVEPRWAFEGAMVSFAFAISMLLIIYFLWEAMKKTEEIQA